MKKRKLATAGIQGLWTGKRASRRGRELMRTGREKSRAIVSEGRRYGRQLLNDGSDLSRQLMGEGATFGRRLMREGGRMSRQMLRDAGKLSRRWREAGEHVMREQRARAIDSGRGGRRSRFQDFKAIVGGIGIGAVIMYLFDPQRGRRRRAIMRDKLYHGSRVLSHGMAVASRDVSNRMQGTVAEARSIFGSNSTEDAILVERVRSKMGRIVSHPGSIEVTSQDGSVTLTGPITSGEVRGLIRLVSSVRGVKHVENHLEVHERAGDVPGLQGIGSRTGNRMDLLQENWSPATRLSVGLLGSALAGIGFSRGSVGGIGTGLLGLGILARSATNMETRRLLGIGAGHRAVDLQKTINIKAPVADVFAFWDNYENFPRFMRNVRDVKARPNGLSHWEVAGPAGVTVDWDAEVTARIENEVLAWKTIPGSVVAHAGIIRFAPTSDNSTRIDIKLSYNPMGGAVGHLVAMIFGKDPKHELDQDLVRMKTLIETGNPPHDASQPLRRQEIAEVVRARGANSK